MAAGRLSRIRVAVVYATDFQRISLGGIATGLKEMARHLDGEFSFTFAGVGDYRRGKEIRKQIDGQQLTIFPVLRGDPVWIPLNLVFTARLFLVRRSIEREADLILIRRIENAIPFIIRKTRPIVLTIHGSNEHMELFGEGYLRWPVIRIVYRLIEKMVLPHVDRVVFVSDHDHGYYARRYPRLREKFLTVPNSIDASGFSPIDRTAARAMFGMKTTDLVVAYVGRLSPEKRVDRLLDAFARLSRERENAYLLIGGEGVEQKRLQALKIRLGLKNVSFLGKLGRNDVRSLMSCADVLALVSAFEGFPNVVLEALACGTPVVATDVGGTGEILRDGLDRLLLPSGDPETVKLRILEIAEQREALKGRCLLRAGDFDSKKIIPKLGELYKGLVRDTRPPVGDGS